MNLADREYWKPSEAAAVLGRTAAYWARTFDAGHVRGYKDRGRHLQADSCRALLERLTAEREVPADTWAAETRAVEAEFRNRHWNKQRERRVG